MDNTNYKEVAMMLLQKINDEKLLRYLCTLLNKMVTNQVEKE